jgi:ATP-dependent DNA helicase RecG
MDDQELKNILDSIRRVQGESEVVEFKEAKNGYDFKDLGQYFSALSNEANLNGKTYAWLVFGVEDKNHLIVGSNFRPNRKNLDNLKSEVANKTTGRITFIEIYEVQYPEGRIVMFQIPPAPCGMPIAFDGHYYGRDGEALVALNIEELERIRAQKNVNDWSAAIVPGATLNDLDPKAILISRDNYKNKFPDKASEVDTWDDLTFLNKAKVLIKGQITRAAIILLGKDECDHFLNPADIKIRWILRDANKNDKDYEI